MAYGFQGFSYPLEEADCSHNSNGYDTMNTDFAKMKKDFGATIVRMYYPLCLQPSVFENALRAGVSNNMAVIFQVWTDFGNSVSPLTSHRTDSVSNTGLGPMETVATSDLRCLSVV